MNVLLIQPEGVDLYTTLLKSETSRGALRFYQPDRLEYGIRVRTASLGSALALVSELRWYIQRYVEEVLFEPFQYLNGLFLLAFLKKVDGQSYLV